MLGRLFLETRMSPRSPWTCLSLCVQSYLSLPAGVSMTEGHCLISPLQHHCSATGLDEDIWSEMQVSQSAFFPCCLQAPLLRAPDMSWPSATYDKKWRNQDLRNDLLDRATHKTEKGFSFLLNNTLHNVTFHWPVHLNLRLNVSHVEIDVSQCFQRTGTLSS